MKIVEILFQKVSTKTNGNIEPIQYSFKIIDIQHVLFYFIHIIASFALIHSVFVRVSSLIRTFFRILVGGQFARNPSDIYSHSSFTK